ncbi:Histone-lysine N-methyltransferase ASHH3 [Vitis vinifera]|uniref:Histone-lysine N-methyltransferase ASHH3 n=1 Tax=Vitis vinifera TaxID=29760 RepID=A0A438H2Y8_VITVI|nr:Histone-lysine N-methyltransferase ASHH3 [Vitis vinifera]
MGEEENFPPSFPWKNNLSCEGRIFCHYVHLQVTLLSWMTEKCGSGIVADEDIKQGEFVIEYVGEVIDDKTCEDRLWKMKHLGETNFYLCEINRDMVIDATYKGNKSRYINHSCDPNTEMQKWRIDGETRIGIFATRDIKRGEHLTYDYQFVQFGADQDCHCGAVGCRRKLGVKPSKPKLASSDAALKLVACQVAMSSSKMKAILSGNNVCVSGWLICLRYGLIIKNTYCNGGIPLTDLFLVEILPIPSLPSLLGLHTLSVDWNCISNEIWVGQAGMKEVYQNGGLHIGSSRLTHDQQRIGSRNCIGEIIMVTRSMGESQRRPPLCLVPYPKAIASLKSFCLGLQKTTFIYPAWPNGLVERYLFDLWNYVHAFLLQREPFESYGEFKGVETRGSSIPFFVCSGYGGLELPFGESSRGGLLVRANDSSKMVAYLVGGLSRYLEGMGLLFSKISFEVEGLVGGFWDDSGGMGHCSLRFMRHFNDWELDIVETFFSILRGNFIGKDDNDKGGLSDPFFDESFALEWERILCREEKEKGALAYVLFLKSDLRKWNKEVFGNVLARKDSALESINYWDSIERLRPLSKEDKISERNAIDEYNHLAILEEIS